MVDDTPLLSAGDDEPKGHRCGGFCCDSKRGTIIVNTITFLLTAIYMILLAVAYNDPTWEQKVADQESIDYINKNYVPLMIMSGVTLAINLGVIFGASIYNICLVGLGVLWTLANLIWSIVVAATRYGNTSGSGVHGFLQVKFFSNGGQVGIFLHCFCI